MQCSRRVFLASLAAGALWPHGAGADPLNATARRARRRLFPEPAPEAETESLGDFPSPLLRIKASDELRFRYTNALDTPLALHWRGMRLPNAMDGTSLVQTPVQPGGAFEARFTPPDPGTYLYHPSVRSVALQQMGRGLAGMVVVEEKDPPLVDHDLPLLLQDWTGPEGGPVLLANGSPEASLHRAAPGARVRLRVASAAARRMIAAGVDGARAQVGAVDGQPCALFEPLRSTLPIAPGARFDIFFDLPREPGAEVAFVLRGMSGAAERAQPLVRFRTEGAARDPLPPIARLPDNPALPARIPLEKAQRVELTIEGAPGGAWRLNGQAADEPAAKPLFTARRGAAVSLGLINKSAAPQLIHVHGHVMRNMHLFDDGWDPYWRDSVIVAEGRTARTAFIADNPGKWLISSGFGVGDGPIGWFQVN